MTGSDYSSRAPKDDSGSMTPVHTVLLSVWLHWLFISRALGFNGLHTSTGHKSPDSAQVCSRVSSKGCEEWGRCDEKENEMYLLHPPLLRTKTSFWAQKNDKWDLAETRPLMPLDVFEMLMSLLAKRQWYQYVFVSHLCGSSQLSVDSRAGTQEKAKVRFLFCAQDQKSAPDKKKAQKKQSRQMDRLAK